MITIDNISKSFGDIKALDEVSFSVDKGEIVGLLGPNGAGKTTTMRIMTGFLSADVGDVHIGDISVLNNSVEAQKLIGYLPESNPLYKEMLVCEFLKYSADLKQIPEGDRKEALDFAVSSVNIADVYYRPINELSKGYKQRVGLAAALLHRPEILILDEPSEGLDPNQRAEIRKLIKTLSKDHTILISTHVMQEVESICNRVVVINKGKIVADDSVGGIARGLGSDIIVEIELEGKAIKTGLKSLKVKNIEYEDSKDKIVKAKIYLDEGKSVQPELSKLIHKNKWVVWRLSESRQQLEDIFQKLTEESNA